MNESTANEQAAARLYAGDIKEGQELTPVIRRPTEVQLFRYCAVTWNSHRIHFDRDYAASEGYPRVLVQSHLHGAFFSSYCTGVAGEFGRLTRLSYSVRRYATPGDVLAIQATVRAVDRSPGDGAVVSLDLREVRESDDVVCALAEAEIFLPGDPAVVEKG